MQSKWKILGVAAAVLVAVPGSAQAQTYFSGYTNGCFHLDLFNPCLPPADASFQSEDPLIDGVWEGLVFENALFSGIANGSDPLAFGGNPNGTGGIEQQNFGAFYLNALPYLYDPFGFVLRVTFMNPHAASQLFTADLTGLVWLFDGAVNIDFDNTVHTWSSGGQSYSVWVDDVNGLDVGWRDWQDGAAIVGHVSAGPGVPGTVTPEPITMVLLGSGLAGVGAVGRRRRKLQAEA